MFLAILLVLFFVLVIMILVAPSMLELFKSKIPIEEEDLKRYNEEPRSEADLFRLRYDESKAQEPGSAWFLKSAKISASTNLNKIACDEVLDIEAGSYIGEWADALGVLTLFEGCKIKKASSATALNIHGDCSFLSLFAPRIVVKAQIDQGASLPQKLAVEDHFASITQEVIWSNEKLLIFPPNTIINNPLVIKKGLKISSGSHIHKSIKCYGGLTLADKVTVEGDIFCEGKLVIGTDCLIKGSVFCQDKVLVGNFTTIGIEGKIKSIIGIEEICLSHGVVIHGYVLTHGKGRIVA